MLTVDFDRLGLQPGDRVLDMGCGAGRQAFEMYRSGRHVDPLSVRYVKRAALSGADLQRFRATLDALKKVDAGAALEDMNPTRPVVEEPVREIDRVALVARHRRGG